MKSRKPRPVVAKQAAHDCLDRATALIRQADVLAPGAAAAFLDGLMAGRADYLASTAPKRVAEPSEAVAKDPE